MRTFVVGGRGVRIVSGLRALVGGFFFFQAEDGIRDLTVTGVQTCALPICRYRRLAAASTATSRRRSFRAAREAGPRATSRACSTRSRLNTTKGKTRRDRSRSEERRVGKEGRSRWSPYH